MYGYDDGRDEFVDVRLWDGRLGASVMCVVAGEGDGGRGWLGSWGVDGEEWCESGESG